MRIKDIPDQVAPACASEIPRWLDRLRLSSTPIKYRDPAGFVPLHDCPLPSCDCSYCGWRRRTEACRRGLPSAIRHLRSARLCIADGPLTGLHVCHPAPASIRPLLLSSYSKAAQWTPRLGPQHRLHESASGFAAYRSKRSAITMAFSPAMAATTDRSGPRRCGVATARDCRAATGERWPPKERRSLLEKGARTETHRCLRTEAWRRMRTASAAACHLPLAACCLPVRLELTHMQASTNASLSPLFFPLAPRYREGALHPTNVPPPRLSGARQRP